MKYLLVLAMLVTSILVGYNLYTKQQVNRIITSLNAKLMEANLEIGKAHTQFGDANKFIGELEGKLQDEIKAKNETLSMYGKLKAAYDAKGSGTTVIQLPGEVVEVPVESTVEFKRWHFYWAETGKVMQDLGPVVASGMRDHRIAIDGALLTEDSGVVFGFQYHLTLKLAGELAQTTTETGAVNHYLTLWELNNEGKKIGKFNLTSFNVVVADARAPQFFWFAPHVDLGVTGGFDGEPFVGGSIGGSLAGYGATKNDLSWRFGRIGMTLAEQPRLELSPFLWNIGGPLPLVSNIWIGPAAVYSGIWGGALLLNVVL